MGQNREAELDEHLTRMREVDAIEVLVRRFPDHARSIRWLAAKNATFRSICEDYALGLRALAYWRAADGASQQKAEEYRRLVEELEDEALAALGCREGE